MNLLLFPDTGWFGEERLRLIFFDEHWKVSSDAFFLKKNEKIFRFKKTKKNENVTWTEGGDNNQLWKLCLETLGKLMRVGENDG